MTSRTSSPTIWHLTNSGREALFVILSCKVETDNVPVSVNAAGLTAGEYGHYHQFALSGTIPYIRFSHCLATQAVKLSSSSPLGAEARLVVLRCVKATEC